MNIDFLVNRILGNDFRRIDIVSEGPRWYKYFLCGVQGIKEELPENVGLSGMNVVVTGNIPQSAGLSSSSAMVSAAALATAHLHKVSAYTHCCRK